MVFGMRSVSSGLPITEARSGPIVIPPFLVSSGLNYNHCVACDVSRESGVGVDRKGTIYVSQYQAGASPDLIDKVLQRRPGDEVLPHFFTYSHRWWIHNL